MRAWLLTTLTLVLLGPATAALGQAQIIPQAEREQMLALVPWIDDAKIREILSDPTLMLYDEDRMGVAYQIEQGNSLNGGSVLTFSNAKFNIARGRGNDFPENQKANGVGGNPNTTSHFPWAPGPGLIGRTDNVDDFKGVWLPKRADGSPWPIVWYRANVRRNIGNQPIRAWNWTFPKGTHIFEFMVMRRPSDGEVFMFEVRLRARELDTWAVDVFRPFPKSHQFVAALKREVPDWQENEGVRRMVAHLEAKPVAFQKMRLHDDNRSRNFRVVTFVDKIPDMGRENDDLVGRLLDSAPWRSALDEYWRVDPEGNRVPAPATEAPFSIVPANADLAFTSVNRVSCARCHRDSLKAARQMDNVKKWWGHVRGNLGSSETGGGILSWHPMDPDLLQGTRRVLPVANVNGRTGQRWRPEFIEAGIFTKYDPAEHPDAMYRLLRDPL